MERYRSRPVALSRAAPRAAPRVGRAGGAGFPDRGRVPGAGGFTCGLLDSICPDEQEAS
ncbi:hypothetical protein ACQEVM_21720 [Streptomyces sp. CA-243310]|uniref:hypothetical protein n=1 Tax=Streptomyces sp. CA-243310 TaxID=3240056 RepID=UPI003D911848